MINTCLFGDASNCLKTLIPRYAGEIQTCLTSPPYFGLRDYGCGSGKVRQAVAWLRIKPGF